MKAITEMSLFNGCEGASMAMSELNIPVKKMYASEVDKFATKAAKLLFPNTIHLGDVTKWREWDIDWFIDKLDAGSPCQGFSGAGKQGGTKAVITGESGRKVEIVIASLAEYEFTRKLKLSGVSVEYLSCSYLFWEFVAILDHIKSVNPEVKFMLENVMMTKNNLDMISKAVGVEPVMINASLVTAQNRKRNYWSNWDISQPEDKGILLKDIIEGGTVDRDKSLCVTTRIAGATAERYLEKSQYQMVIDDKTIMTDTFSERQKGRKCLVDEPKDKAASLCAMEYAKNGRQGDYIQCDKEGNQAVFRPCELRDTPPSESALCHHVATATDIKANEANKRVYADTGKSPTVTTMGGGHREPKVLVGRVVGRKINPVTGKRDDYNPDIKTVQRLEARPDEKSGCITTVQKDNVLITDPKMLVAHLVRDAIENDLNSNESIAREKERLKDHPMYRKLTPRECMRLQGFPAWVIDKLLETEIVNGKEKPVISNSQLYKMTGNGWAIPVITHILQCLLDTGWMQD